MATIVTRAGKGSALTFTEGDANFTNLNTDKIENVVEDLTPQLGGNLDVQGNFITTSVTDGNIQLSPNGIGLVFAATNKFMVGNANSTATITTNGTGNLTLDTNGGTNSGDITIQNGTDGNIQLSPNGTGEVIMNAAVVKIGDSGDTGNANLGSQSGNTVLQGQITGTPGGNITLNGGTNGGITIAPAGTGTVSISKTTTVTAGDLNLSAGTLRAPVISSVTNTYNPTSQFFMGQSHSTADANNINFARTRGTFASQAAVQSGDELFEMFVLGNDGSATTTAGLKPAWIISTVMTDAPSTNLLPHRTEFRVNTTAGAYSNYMTVANDAVVRVREIGTTSDVTDLNISAGTDGTGKVRVNSTQTEFKTNGTYGGELRMKAGILDGATDYDKTTEISVIALTTDGSKSATFEVKTHRFDGTNYTPTQENDFLGRFTFLGNYSSSSTPAANTTGGFISVKATDDFTETVQGTAMQFNINKTGTDDNLLGLEINSQQSTFRSDAIAFEDSTAAALKGGQIDYRRTFGCFHKTAAVTAAAADTVYEFDWTSDVTAHVNTQGVTVSDTSRLNIDAAGDYMVTLEFQAKNTDNADRLAWIWLAKNGTDLTETAIQVKLQKENEQIITKQWLVEGVTAAQYLEVRFAVDNASGISLQTVASQASPFVRPAVPSATITITPVGA
jgi:hypothetical protein